LSWQRSSWAARGGDDLEFHFTYSKKSGRLRIESSLAEPWNRGYCDWYVCTTDGTSAHRRQETASTNLRIVTRGAYQRIRRQPSRYPESSSRDFRHQRAWKLHGNG
jgi:hypothetical protein